MINITIIAPAAHTYMYMYHAESVMCRRWAIITGVVVVGLCLSFVCCKRATEVLTGMAG